MARLVGVRIAVAVNEHGHWNAFGYDGISDSTAMLEAQDPLVGTIRVYVVTAPLVVPDPEPEVVEVAGTVEPVESDPCTCEEPAK